METITSTQLNVELIIASRQDIIKAYAISMTERFAMDAEDEITDVTSHIDDLEAYIHDIKLLSTYTKAVDCIGRLLKGGYSTSVLPPRVMDQVEKMHAERTKFALIIMDANTNSVLGAIDGDQVVY